MAAGMCGVCRSDFKTMELQALIMIDVKTKDPSALPIQVRFPLEDNAVSADALLKRICQRCGLKESSYKYFTLCSGVDKPVVKYRSSDKISVPAKDLSFQKWCLNTESERFLIRTDPKAAHLLFIQAKHDVESVVGAFPTIGIGKIMAFIQSEGKSPESQILLKILKRTNKDDSGKLITSVPEKMKLDECLDPEFLVEEQYILLCHSLPDYQSIVVERCIVCKPVQLKTIMFEKDSKLNILVSRTGLKIVSESSDYVTFAWQEIVKWEYNKGTRTVSYLIYTTGDREKWLSLKTVQAEYLLAATFEGIKELQSEELSTTSLYHSSMITQTPDGGTRWTNTFFCPPKPNISKEKIHKIITK